MRRHVEAWEEAGAGKFAISVIKDGFKLNMAEMPGDYEERNNKSFREHEAFAVEEVEKMVKSKILREVSREEVKCVNPLTVAVNSNGKKRLCIDLSRYVNSYTKVTKFKIESTMQFLQVVKKGDYMWSFDLRSAYHQIPIFEEHQKYLGLSITKDGRKRFFIFCSLPFGLNDAARALTKLLRFPLQRWRERGIHSFIHLDDGIGVKAGRGKAQACADMMKGDLDRFGLMTSDNKCTWEVTQDIVWTGWRINTARFMIFVPEEKLLRAEEKVNFILRKVGKAVKVKELSSVVGTIISFGLALGRVARFHTRFSSMQIAEVAEKRGWAASLVFQPEVVEELRFWEKNLRRLNGQRIRKTAGVQVVRPLMLYSDAGGHMAGGARVENKKVWEDTVFQVNLTAEEVGESSTFRELRGIEEGLKALKGRLQGNRVRWHCDNWAACAIVEYGSMKVRCHEVAIRINELVMESELDFEMVWRSRETEEIRFADRISKDYDFSDYRISMSDFRELERRFGGFSADYFASDYSYRMKPFFSRYESAESAGSDAFEQSWSRGFGFFHPPVGLVPRVLEKAREDRAEGILLVPDWKGSMMLTEIRRCSRVELVGSFQLLV